MKHKQTLFTMLFLTLTVVAVSAISIDRVRSDPRSYVGETVMIRGEVTESRRVLLFDVWLETVYDRTGTITVITSEPRDVSDRFREEVRIVGIQTEGAEDGAEGLTDALAEFLVDHEIVDRRQARSAARRIADFMSTVLPHFDTALFGVERD